MRPGQSGTTLTRYILNFYAILGHSSGCTSKLSSLLRVSPHQMTSMFAHSGAGDAHCCHERVITSNANVIIKTFGDSSSHATVFISIQIEQSNNPISSKRYKFSRQQPNPATTPHTSSCLTLPVTTRYVELQYQPIATPPTDRN